MKGEVEHVIFAYVVQGVVFMLASIFGEDVCIRNLQ